MAPELLDPEGFGFTGKLENQLPSEDTDIYAIGMTILEVSAHPPPYREFWIHPLAGSNWVFPVRQCPS